MRPPEEEEKSFMAFCVGVAGMFDSAGVPLSEDLCESKRLTTM